MLRLNLVVNTTDFNEGAEGSVRETSLVVIVDQTLPENHAEGDLA